MSTVKRVVSTSFWEDDKVVNEFSPEDKYFMLYLLTNPHTKQIGIYSLNKKIAAFEMGYSVEAITVLLDRFENKYGIIKVSNETSEIAIKNYLCYSVVKGGQPVLDLLNKEVKTVKDQSLISFVIHSLSERHDMVATVSNFVDTLKNEIDNVNDNDNDNDSTCDVHSTYGKRTQKIKKEKPIRHKYGEYKNVLLSDEDMEKLKKEFPNDWQDRIENLSSYVESTGKTYKNHLATIRNWARKEKPNGDNGKSGGYHEETESYGIIL